MNPPDDFKWFGEGFEGFPKRLPEDVVEYIIFVIDFQLSDIRIRERLQAFQRALISLEKKFLKEYIWQRESIALDLVREDGRWLLKGSTSYGDSVADEWLIVYILRQLSKEFEDTWIRIYDTDGEFLLIEAANALPNWLNPEVAENRVWIHNHRMLVIPLSRQETAGPLKQAEALSIIQDTPARPQHYSKIENEAFHRLKGYPAAISENQHHVNLSLPRTVAHILNINPSYIAPSIEAFYLRDPISLRLLQPEKAEHALAIPPEDFVDVSVRFTKVLYAQLLGQNWDPPGPYGEALERSVKGSTMPERAGMGVKVAAGMEMLIQHKFYADKKAARELKLLLQELEHGDDALPTDTEIAAWPKREDDEGWLDIDFAEFERELAGKGGSDGFGDKSAQDNLKKMVERFTAFINDEEAGLEGADGLDPMDVDNDSDADNRGWEDPEDSSSSHGTENQDDEKEEEAADIEFAEYNQAYEKFMTLSAAEKALLTDEARELALAEEADREEDEEIKKLSEKMEAELFGHGALNLDPPRKPQEKRDANRHDTPAKGKGKAKVEEFDQEQLDQSGDDDVLDDDVLDDDYNLVDNMLKAFKGQSGMPGPASNLMGLMGVQFPRDADDERMGKRVGNEK